MSYEDKTKLKLLVAWLALIAAIILLHSCSIDKKAQRKTTWLLGHDRLDDACSRFFPNRDSVEYKDSVHFDTLYLDNTPAITTDTVYRNDTVFITQSVKCPPNKVITILKTDTVKVFRSNTAEEDRLKGELLDKDKQIKAKDDIISKQQVKIDKEDKWKIYFLILAFVNVLGFVFRFLVLKRPI